ncbi:hypothetical protein AGABI2DRAFT_113968 [Agaricus bisporus var. bisporus H97]|uniref:hypothetical protein n=1 Tax=Agaricus bisporus var. bisporus (strain H97 / ATCC MYA-4626 / FGSC 10389) TaxID=936046 RepID=UPI00029F6EDC|nr:hypothetical protein AGABI2DRAFT_113968 [Agaricus bisporus var. bisporus H97]EKV51230.1 hypothetical protein AGABI2DRAFT_113968 [Agaricus bisporus var. bisporus H97]
MPVGSDPTTSSAPASSNVPATSTTANTTPSSRMKTKSPSNATRARVDAADAQINGGSCLIGNIPKSLAVEYCHVIPRSMTRNGKFASMTCIEWSWNMRHRTLNLDTRYNIFLAGASWHYLHDKGSWKLLPPLSVINKYLAELQVDRNLNRSHFPEIDARVFTAVCPEGFEYKVIPFIVEDPAHMKILRLKDEPNSDNPSVSVYSFPFADFPPVRCHIHPKFAICELGRYLNSGAISSEQWQGLETRLKEYWPNITGSRSLYAAWTAAGEEAAMRSPSFKSETDPSGCEDEDGDGDGGGDGDAGGDGGGGGGGGGGGDGGGGGGGGSGAGSTRTNPRRLCVGKRRRDHSPSPGSNKAARKRKNSGSRGSRLSSKTLGDHNHAEGKGAWTPESLATWAQSVADFLHSEATEV